MCTACMAAWTFIDVLRVCLWRVQRIDEECGTLESGSNAVRQQWVDAGLLPALREVMETLKGEAAVMEQACVALRNITAGVCVVGDGWGA